jgi:glycosyltransferase involved in cell wall biosynthesis
MTDQKGPDRAILAARATGLPIKLAGDIDVGNPTYFEKRVRPLLGPQAEYVGPIDDQEKQTFLGEASVFLMPIDWPEPFGLVVIEAMACGTPVVAAPFGSMPELITEEAGLVVPVDRFSAAIHQALSLDRRAVRGAFEGRFTDDLMAEGYTRIYRRLCCEVPPHRP